MVREAMAGAKWVHEGKTRVGAPGYGSLCLDPGGVKARAVPCACMAAMSPSSLVNGTNTLIG